MECLPEVCDLVGEENYYKLENVFPAENAVNPVVQSEVETML